MPRAKLVNFTRNISITFDFAKPADRNMTDLWKGWFKSARKACSTIPTVFEGGPNANGSNYHDYINLRTPEVSDNFITYRICHRDDPFDLYVLVLCRK